MSLNKLKVISLEIETLDPFSFCNGPWVWSWLPQGPCGGLEAESSVLSSHEVYNLIFIASLPNKVYGTTGIHLVKNAGPLYEFLMMEEERWRHWGALWNGNFFFFLITSLVLFFSSIAFFPPFLPPSSFSFAVVALSSLLQWQVWSFSTRKQNRRSSRYQLPTLPCVPNNCGNFL